MNNEKSVNQILIEKVENGFVIRSQRTVRTTGIRLFGGSGDSSDNCRWYIAANEGEVNKVLSEQLPTLKTSIDIEEEIRKKEAEREAQEESNEQEDGE
jgi:hypothetical protein